MASPLSPTHTCFLVVTLLVPSFGFKHLSYSLQRKQFCSQDSPVCTCERNMSQMSAAFLCFSPPHLPLPHFAWKQRFSTNRRTGTDVLQYGREDSSAKWIAPLGPRRLYTGLRQWVPSSRLDAACLTGSSPIMDWPPTLRNPVLTLLTFLPGPM